MVATERLLLAQDDSVILRTVHSLGFFRLCHSVVVREVTYSHAIIAAGCTITRTVWLFPKHWHVKAMTFTPLAPLRE